MNAPGPAGNPTPVPPLTSGAYAGLEAAFLEVMRRRNSGHLVALATETPASRAARGPVRAVALAASA